MNGIRARAIVVAGITLVLACSVGLGQGFAAEPAALNSYRVTSHGDAVQFRFVDQGAPVFPGGEVFASSPATAAAFVDSTGQSAGFASAPYPGAAWIAMPGTYNGVRPTGSPEAPPYPWYVSTNYPGNPEAQMAQGPVMLKSKSGADTSTADARSGVVTGPPAGVLAAAATSSVTVDQATGALSAVSNVAMDGFALGSDVAFGHLSSRVKLAAAAGKPATKETSFDVVSFRVGTQKVGFTDQGFVIGGAPAQKVDAAPLNTVTSPGGVTLTYLPAVETPTSIESAGFSVRYQQTVPNQGVVGVIMTFGRVKAELDSLAPVPDLGSADVGVPAGTSSGGGAPVTGADGSPAGSSGGSGQPSGGSAVATSTSPPLGGFFRSGATGPDLGSTAAADTSQPAGVGGNGDAPSGGATHDQALALARHNAATLAALSRTSAGHHLYLALAIAGLAALAGGVLFGRRAVRAAPSAALRFPSS